MRAYRIPYSTNVERLALALGHKGIAVEWVEVDPTDRSPVVEVSGQSLTPVVVLDDGEVLHDSMPIIARLEQLHPDPPLYPRDAAERARLDVFVDWFNRVWKLPPNALNDSPGDPRTGGWAAELRGSLDIFGAMLTSSAHLFGEDFGAADVCAFPFLKYATLPVAPDDVDSFHHVLREHLASDSHPRLADWIARVDARPRG